MASTLEGYEGAARRRTPILPGFPGPTAGWGGGRGGQGLRGAAGRDSFGNGRQDPG
ncbi:hypothetical protein GCM10010149_02840 [Nonomuraea roseoviolacea subsp. roseoviolacea]